MRAVKTSVECIIDRDWVERRLAGNCAKGQKAGLSGKRARELNVSLGDAVVL